MNIIRSISKFVLAFAVTVTSTVVANALNLEQISRNLSKLDKTRLDRTLATTGPYVTVRLEGGNTGEGLNTVLRSFNGGMAPYFADRKLIPMRKYTVKPGDSLCKILESEINLIRAARENCPITLRTTLAQMNGIKSVNGEVLLKVGMNIQIPNIKLTEYTFKRYFDRELNFDKRQFTSIAKTWKNIIDQKATIEAAEIAKQYSEQMSALVLTGYKFEFSLESNEDHKIASDIAYNTSTENVKIDVSNAKQLERKKLHSADPAEYYSNCEMGQPATSAAPYLGYFQKHFQLSAEDASESCHQNGSGTVILVDQQLAPHVDLEQVVVAREGTYFSSAELTAQDPAASGACSIKRFVKDLHHATYMAGIMAANKNEERFSGLYPSAKILPVIWKTGVDELDLESQFRTIIESAENEAILKPLVFVMASEFDPFQGDALTHTRSQLRNPDFRYKKSINVLIKRHNIAFFVISAGQDNSNVGVGSQLRRVTPTSPQNMGNLANVIVVAACKNCTGRNPVGASLWSNSNYSTRNIDSSVVYLAAPGGDDIPGLTSGTGIGQTKGTSPAAAFVGGVAAQMGACYPVHYRRASRLKLRLWLTSNPIFRGEEQEKLMGGVIDPHLATLDPDKTWLRQGEVMRSIKTLSWCRASMRLKKNGQPLSGSLSDLTEVRRITRSNSNELHLFKVSPDNHHSERRFVMNTVGPGTHDENIDIAQVTYQDGSTETIKLRNIHDLIISERMATDIQAHASCEGNS